MEKLHPLYLHWVRACVALFSAASTASVRQLPHSIRTVLSFLSVLRRGCSAGVTIHIRAGGGEEDDNPVGVPYSTHVSNGGQRHPYVRAWD